MSGFMPEPRLRMQVPLGGPDYLWVRYSLALEDREAEMLKK